MLLKTEVVQLRDGDVVQSFVILRYRDFGLTQHRLSGMWAVNYLPTGLWLTGKFFSRGGVIAFAVEADKLFEAWGGAQVASPEFNAALIKLIEHYGIIPGG
jgi:hypothetical protein